MLLDDLLILIFLLIVSAFFSGSEIAFVVANKLKLEVKARKNNLSAINALYFSRNPQNFFSTVLIGNNIVNITFASLCAVVLQRFFSLNELSILLISTFLLLIFGELIPKYLSRELSDRIILVTVLPVRAFSFVLYPFIKLSSKIYSLLLQSSSVSEENISSLFAKEDIESLVQESREAGVVDKEESDIIGKVFDLGEQRVYEAMRPRTEITGVEIGQSIDEVIKVFIESGFSKIPVYEENLDNIKGVIFAYDLFKFPQDLKSITREIIFVPETKKSLDMLNEFLEKHVSIAIVIDEFGGTAGIITIEDIMEELFGEIRDEYDVEEDICRRVAADTYLISGRVEADFVNEKYELGIPPGDYETIGGFITTRLGRIPAEGENINIGRFNILIARATPIKIEVVKLIVNPDIN